MERMIYEPTAKQVENWALIDTKLPTMPTNEEFQAMWKKQHHGKVAGWGMGKRDWIISNLKNSSEYQIGLWQGRVDCAQGLTYGEKDEDKSYNLGYYRGYTGFQHSGTGGWDRAQAKAFEENYCKKELA